jgi:hypothetical protein
VKQSPKISNSPGHPSFAAVPVQGQTQVGDIAEVIGPVHFHDVHGPSLALGADPHQPYNPLHVFPQVKDRPENALVTRRLKNLLRSPMSLPTGLMRRAGVVVLT